MSSNWPWNINFSYIKLNNLNLHAHQCSQAWNSSSKVTMHKFLNICACRGSNVYCKHILAYYFIEFNLKYIFLSSQQCTSVQYPYRSILINAKCFLSINCFDIVCTIVKYVSNFLFQFSFVKFFFCVNNCLVHLLFFDSCII